jgi:hypothetical protein
VKGACLLELLDQSMRTATGATLWQLQKELASSSYSSRMVALVLASLVSDGLVNQHDMNDQYEGDYLSFSLSEKGQRHLLRDYSTLMRHEKERANNQRSLGWNKTPASSGYDDLDDDIPF